MGVQMKEEQLQGNSVAGGSVIGRFSCRGFQSLRGSVIGVVFWGGVVGYHILPVAEILNFVKKQQSKN